MGATVGMLNIRKAKDTYHGAHLRACITDERDERAAKVPHQVTGLHK